MAHKTIKQAENTFHTAICTHADYFESDIIRRAESLLLEARHIADNDPTNSKELAHEAEQNALDSIARTESEKKRRKKIFGSETTALILELSRHKKTLEEIKAKINNPLYLMISQRIQIAEVYIRQANDGLDQECFEQFGELSVRSRRGLFDVSVALSMGLERVHHRTSFK